MYEGMVEDINMLLNTGDIPNLYGMDEKVEILDKMQTAVRETVSIIEASRYYRASLRPKFAVYV